MPEIYDETYSDITGKTWKYSTAWSQQLWNARNKLEELKRFAEWIPAARVQDENVRCSRLRFTIYDLRFTIGEIAGRLKNRKS